MRVGVRLEPDATTIAARARAAEAAGLDLVWVPDGGSDTTAAPALAASVVAATRHVRVAVDVPLGAQHPLHAAEEVAVLDLLSGGRVVVVAQAEAGCDPWQVEEALTVARASWRARPFRHEGPTWSVPANLPTNTVNTEYRVRVTPTPVQFAVPVWVQGREELVERLAVPAVHDLGELARPGPPVPAQVAGTPTPGVLRIPSGPLDVPAVVSRLRDARRRLGVDLAVIDPIGDPTGVLDTLAGRVRGALQLDRLPAGVEDDWDRRRG